MMTFIIPFLNMVMFLALYVSLLVVVWQAIDAVNALADEAKKNVPMFRD